MKFSTWEERIHLTPKQKQRFEESKSDECEPVSIDFEQNSATFKDDRKLYKTSLNHCTCRDFFIRQMPCKHIYRLAIELNMIDKYEQDPSISDFDSFDLTLACIGNTFLHAHGPNIIVQKKRSREVFPISKIQVFSLTEPKSHNSFGTVTFFTAQAPTGGVGLGLGISAAVGAENKFSFVYDNLSDALKLYKYVTEFEKPTLPVSDPSSLGNNSFVSVADEIRALKSLLDDGIITQDEFDEKKKQLLFS
jgi:hypothetical protein